MEYKTTTADTYLEILTDCPYCGETQDILDSVREFLQYGELSAESINVEICCCECKKEFIVTDIFY